MGREAVEKARSFRPDVLLIDVRMPNMDGRQALEEIRATPGLELLPVIAVSASSVSVKQRELDEKFSGCLRKPFTRRELFNELAQFLPRRETKEKAAPRDLAAAAPGSSGDLPWAGYRDHENCEPWNLPSGLDCGTAWQSTKSAPSLKN